MVSHVVRLRCLWLDYGALSRLAQALDRLWQQDGQGEAVGYSWAEYLREEGWAAAGLAGQTVLRLSVGAEGAGSGEGAQGRDGRVVPMLEVLVRTARARVAAEQEEQEEEEGAPLARASSAAIREQQQAEVRPSTQPQSTQRSRSRSLSLGMSLSLSRSHSRSHSRQRLCCAQLGHD